MADDDTGHVEDTADTARCGVVEGSGCGDPRREPMPCSESGESGETGEPAHVEGGGCATAPWGGGWVLWLALALALGRRARVAAALVLGVCLAWAPTARAMDGEVSDPLDGGPFPLLREAEVGAPWTPQAVYWGSFIKDPVVLVYGDTATPLLEQTWTRSLGASIRLGRVLRFGLAWPRHKAVASAYTYLNKAPGDLSLWTAVPILEGDERLSLAWYAQMDLPTGSSELYLGDLNGAVKTHLALGAPLGRTDGLLNLGVRLATPEELPGISWGKRLEWGTGLGVPVFGPTSLRIEAQGSVGLPPAGVRADVPVEALLSVQTLMPGPMALTVGAGAGLSRGLGSPAWRLLVAIDARPRDQRDTDQDGVIDSRDRCVEDPEDLDLFEDNDGCPDPDNDRDGFLDPSDACRDEAEVLNGLADDDGCPDAAVRLSVIVRAAPPASLERARLSLGEASPVEVVADEPYEVVLPSGTLAVKAEAPGFKARELPVELGEGPAQALVIELTALGRGGLSLRIVSPEGAPLAGQARLGEQPWVTVEATGSRWERPEGPLAITVSAPGYRAASLKLEIPPGADLEQVVTLLPTGARLEGRQVRTGQPVPFAVGSDALLPEADGPLGDVLALLQENNDIELLRIEGHADERADSRYNLDLSRRRAEAVRAWLISRGIAPERLEAIGTGEARPATGADASRRVEFVVLIWDDEAREHKEGGR